MHRRVYILIAFCFALAGEVAFGDCNGACPVVLPSGGGAPTGGGSLFDKLTSAAAKQIGEVVRQSGEYKKAQEEIDKAQKQIDSNNASKVILDKAAANKPFEEEIKKQKEIQEKILQEALNQMLGAAQNLAGANQVGGGSGGGGAPMMPPPGGGGGDKGGDKGGDSNNPPQTAQTTPQPAANQTAMNTKPTEEKNQLNDLKIPERQVASTPPTNANAEAQAQAQADAIAQAKLKAAAENAVKAQRQELMVAQSEAPQRTVRGNRTYEPTGNSAKENSGPGLGIDMSPRESIASNRTPTSRTSSAGLGGALLGVAPKKASAQNRLLTAAVVPVSSQGKGVAPTRNLAAIEPKVSAVQPARGVTGAKALQRLTMTEEAKRIVKRGAVPKALQATMNQRLKIVRGSMPDSRSRIVREAPLVKRSLDGIPHRVVEGSAGSHFR